MKKKSYGRIQAGSGASAQATTIVGLAKELGVRRKLLYQWRALFQAEGRAGAYLGLIRAASNQEHLGLTGKPQKVALR